MKSPEFDKYRIVRSICKKYCFTLYEAEDVVVKQPRALKVLNEELSQDSVAVFHFLNGARMMRLLHHPCISQVYKYGKEESHFVIVSEPVALETLTIYIHEERPIALKMALDLVAEIAAVLREAHLHGLVHGMLNPSSIYVGQEGTVKIDDFGYHWLVSYLDRLDESEAGYLHYHIAPEAQGGSQKVDGRCDIYSLGVILLQLLTDCLPFDPLDNATPQKQDLTSIMHTLRDVLSQYPQRLENLVTKMLHNHPDMRFQNMMQLQQELKALKQEQLAYQRASDQNKDSYLDSGQG